MTEDLLVGIKSNLSVSVLASMSFATFSGRLIDEE